jgi:hypothetical protein
VLREWVRGKPAVLTRLLCSFLRRYVRQVLGEDLLQHSDERERFAVLTLPDVAPQISPVAPASIDYRALPSIVSSPACAPPETSSRVRLAERTTTSMACWEENSAS